MRHNTFTTLMGIKNDRVVLKFNIISEIFLQRTKTGHFVTTVKIKHATISETKLSR